MLVIYSHILVELNAIKEPVLFARHGNVRRRAISVIIFEAYGVYDRSYKLF
jgi:hypothetical protein